LLNKKPSGRGIELFTLKQMQQAGGIKPARNAYCIRPAYLPMDKLNFVTLLQKMKQDHGR